MTKKAVVHIFVKIKKTHRLYHITKIMQIHVHIIISHVPTCFNSFRIFSDFFRKKVHFFKKYNSFLPNPSRLYFVFCFLRHKVKKTKGNFLIFQGKFAFLNEIFVIDTQILFCRFQRLRVKMAHDFACRVLLKLTLFDATFASENN